MKRLCRMIATILILSLIMPGLIVNGSALAQDTLRVAKILATEGDVKILRGGGEKSFAAFKGMGLTEGDTIITGRDGRVTVEVAQDKEMEIAENTRIIISQLVQSVKEEADKSSFTLKAGQVFNKIKDKLRPGAKYEIRTPTAVMGVRGTQYFVGLNNGLAEVITLEGQVYVTIDRQVSGTDGAPGSESVEIEVSAGQIMVQTSGLEPSQYTMEDLTSNEGLSLFVLETLQNLNEEQPGLINPELLENLAERINQAMEEQQEEEDDREQPVIVYTDGQGEDGSQSGNQDNPPSGGNGIAREVIIEPVEDISLSVSEVAERIIGLDPEDAQLSISVDNNEIVNAENNGNIVYIEALAEGSAIITITASKEGYNSATTTFAVIVSQLTNRENPKIAYDPNQNRFLMVYNRTSQYGESNIFGRFISAEGMADAEFCISAFNSLDPEIAYNSVTGNYLVVWADSRSGENRQIYGQIIDTDGSLLGDNFLIGTPLLGDLNDPTVAYNPIARNYLVAWEEQGAGDLQIEICGQVVEELGQLVGPKMTLISMNWAQYDPVLAYSTSGNCYLLAFTDSNNVRGQLLDPYGVALLPEIIDIAVAGQDQDTADIVADDTNNRFLVVWEDSRNNWQNDIYGRFVGIDGSLGTDILVNNYPDSQSSPSVALGSEFDKRFLVIWEEAVNGDIGAQYLTSEGDISGPAMSFNVITGVQNYPQLAYNSTDNNFMMAYIDFEYYPPRITTRVVGEVVTEPTANLAAEDIKVINYLSGDDVIEIDDLIEGTIIRVYNEAVGGTLLGTDTKDEGSVGVTIEGGFAPGQSSIYVSSTEPYKLESVRTEVAIPQALMTPDDNFMADTVEYGYGRVTFTITTGDQEYPLQYENIKSALGLDPSTSLTFRAYVAKDPEGAINTMPVIDDPAMDMAELVFDDANDTYICAIPKLPGNYPYAIGVYDGEDNLLTYYVSGTEWVTVWDAFHYDSTSELGISPIFDQDIYLFLDESGTTSFIDLTDWSGVISLEGALAGLTVNSVTWQNEYQIIVNISGDLSTMGPGIIKISSSAFSELEHIPEPIPLYYKLEVTELT